MPIRMENWGDEVCCDFAALSHRVIATNNASSGSPKKPMAAPSPVSRIMRSFIAISLIALERSELKRFFDFSYNHLPVSSIRLSLRVGNWKEKPLSMSL